MYSTTEREAQLIEELEALRRRVSELEQRRAVSREDRLMLAIAKKCPFSVWACNRNFTITLWEPGAEAVYGHSKEEAIGENYLNLFVSEEEREQSAIDCIRVIEEDYLQRNFFAWDSAKNGTKRGMLTNCFRIWDDDEHDWLQAEVALEVPELGIRRLLEAERLKLLERLRKVSTFIDSSIHEEQGLQRVLERTVASVNELLLEDTTSMIYVYDEHKCEWLLVSTESIDHLSTIPHLQLNGGSLGSYAMRSKRALFIDANHELPTDYVEIKDWNQDIEHSIAVLPLVFGSESIGVLFIALRKDYVFTKESEEALKFFAEQAAVAIQNARLVQDLRELNRLVAEKQELVTRSMIALDFVHRLNNLAGPIRGWVALIRERLDPSEPRYKKMGEYLDEIDHEVKALLQAAGKLDQKPEKQDVDVNFMLSAILRNIRIQYREVQIQAELAPNLYPVRAIYMQLSAAIGNVINNGVEAMPNGGILALKSRNVFEGGRKWVEITIQDSGSGLSQEEQKRIWEIGYSTKGPGRGFGLWRTKQIIEDLGGSITLVESGPNIGTTFAILLPAVSPNR